MPLLDTLNLDALKLEPAERAAQLLGAISFVPAPVGHDHLLGSLGEHPLEGGPRLLLAPQESQPKIDWRLPVRVRRARKAHQPPVDAADLLGLEVLEQVREEHSPRLAKAAARLARSGTTETPLPPRDTRLPCESGRVSSPRSRPSGR